MDADSTVRVTRIEGYAALRMYWETDVRAHDVRTAFHTILTELEAAREGLYIVVNIQNDPNFPIAATITGALTPFRHPKLLKWLVCGSNPAARIIEAMLVRVTGYDKVNWYDDEADVMAFLDRVKTSSAAA